MRPNKLMNALAAMGCLFIIPVNSWARGGASQAQNIPIGVGISHPSTTSIFFRENPAGHSLYKGMNLQLMGSSADDNSNIKTAGGGFLYGASDFGVAVGAITRDDGDDTTEEHPSGFLGFGFHLSSISTSIGLASSVTKDINDDITHSEDVGILINPGGKLTLGIVAYDAFDDVSAWGVGVNFGLGSNWSLALDAINYDEADQMDFWPGAKYSSPEFEFAGGLHFNDGGSGDDDDFFLSLGFKPWNLLSIQFHYQLIQKYYFGLQLSF